MPCIPTDSNYSSTENDSEQMITLSTIASLNDPLSRIDASNTLLENAIVLKLARGTEVSELLTNVSNKVFTCSDVSGSYYANEISSDLRNVFDLPTNAMHDGHYALSSKFSPPSDKTYYDVSYSNIGNDVSKNIAVIDPTLSIYDSYIDITTTENYGPYYDTSNSTPPSYSATFNSSQPTNNFIRAINSYSNNSTQENLMSVQEDVDFNTTFALGRAKTKYYTVNATTGQLVPTEIDTEYNITENGIICDVSYASYSNDYVGAYKIQSFPDKAGTEFSFDSNQPIPIVDLSNTFPPFVNFFNNLSTARSLPGSNLSLDNFATLFSESEITSILAGYRFDISAVSLDDSGYSLSNSSFKVKNDSNIFTLDSSDLSDNVLYMKNYVNFDHDLSFNSATLSISAVDSANTSNISNNFSLDTTRETLTQEFIKNGQIILNNRNPDTRTSTLSESGSIFSTKVFYNEEQGESVSSDVMTNGYVEYDTTLFFKNPQYDTNNHYLVSNDAYLDLFNVDRLVNSRFSVNNVEFNSLLSEKGYDNNSLHVFKLTPHQKLVAINGVISTETNSEVSNLSVSANLSNFPMLLPSNNDTINKLEAIINLKDVSNLSIWTEAKNAGWVLDNSPDIGHSKLTTTTASAHRSQSSVTSWPSLSAVRSVLTSNSNMIYYSIDISANTYIDSASTTLHQNFYVVIDWGNSPTNLNNRLIIGDDDLRRTEKCTNNLPVKTPIPNGFQVTTTDTIQFNFDLQMLPYDDLVLTTPLFISTTTYCIKKDAIQYSGKDYELDTEFTPMHTITLDNNTTRTPITGSLNKSDFSELSVYIRTKNDFTPEVALTDKYNMSAFYHIPITMELFRDANHALGDITFSLLPLTFCSMKSASAYIINLVAESDPISYNIDYCTATFDETTGLFSNMDNCLASSSSTISVATGYTALSWSRTSHSVSISHEGLNNSTTVLTVSDESDNVFTLKIHDFKHLNTTAFVTYCSKDIYKVIKSVGSDSDTIDTTTTTYVGTNYATSSLYNDYNSVHIRIDSGVLLVGTQDTLDFNTCSNVGYNIQFSLLPDKISVNMINFATDPLSDITSLKYQYIDNDNDYIKSRTLTIDKYRGYLGTNDTDQVYVINRDQLVATFRILNAGSVVAQQSFNVYADSNYTVSDLTLDDNSSLGAIGLNISFTSSMLTSDDIYLFNIYTKGDNVSITITNPANTEFIPYHSSKTLKDFNLYEFSGMNFIYPNEPTLTGAPLSITSSRLKMSTNFFSNTKVIYSIYKKTRLTEISKVNEYVGHPSSCTSWQLLYSCPSDTMFGEENKKTVNHISIWRPENMVILPTVSYLVVTPPYLHFKQMSNKVSISMLPFSTTTYASNLKSSYLPVSNNTELYNPFATRTVSYINSEENVEVVFGNDTNNVAITKLSSKAPRLYGLSPSTTVNKFFVFGNNYNIKLYLGLPSASTPILITTLYNGLADNLVSSSQDLSFNSYNRTTGVVKMSFLQPLLSGFNGFNNLSTVFTTSNAVYSAIYADTGELPKSIHISVNSFFLSKFGNNGSTTNRAVIDVPLLQGIAVNLYTRNIVVDGTGAAKVYIYKYVPLSGLSPLNQNDQVKTIFFNQRYYKIIDVPPIVIKQTDIPNWDTLINSISVNPSSWIEDTEFSDTTFVSLVNYNLEAKNDIYTLIFACENNGASKFTYITKTPLLTMTNKLGMPIFQISADGVVKAQSITTAGITLMPLSINIPIVNSLQNTTLCTTDAFDSNINGRKKPN